MSAESEKRICQNCKHSFTIEPEDFAFYDKIKVPPPTFCVDCREQRRMVFRNERHLYKRKCDLCGKEIVSRVSPDKKYPMYCTKCWWGDGWDPYSYGRDYDFSKPFFEQWKELFFSVPHISILNSNSVNSDWVNQESDDKNCYLNVGGAYNEDSAYTTYGFMSKNCYDNYWVEDSEYCSNCVHLEKGYFTHYSNDCDNCMNVLFSYDCHNCNNVIGCAGLRNKKYCILNEQHSKESYEQFLKEHPFSSQSGITWWKEKSLSIWNKSPHRENQILRSINSTGDYLSECRGAKNCWQDTKLENCKNIFVGGWGRDSYDCSCFGGNELDYECAHSSGAYNSKAIMFCITSDPLKKMTINSVEYSVMMNTASNCFGCASVKNGEYVILNKKYTKEEYEELLPKIIKHMNEMPYTDKKGRKYGYGEFFPAEFSPFGYNETAAMEAFPLTKEKAEESGFIWSDYVSDAKYEFSDYQIPDDIDDVQDDIFEKVLKCEKTGKAYRILPMELSFYRKTGIPIPRIAPQARHDARIAQLLPKKLFDRKCDNCKKEIKTPYSQNRLEKVYCIDCYQKEML